MKKIINQSALFDTTSTKSELVIRNSAQKGVLSKAQKEFNILTGKIESKQKEKLKIEYEYEELLKIYFKTLFPAQQNLKNELRSYILEIYNAKLGAGKALKKNEQASLNEILSHHISEYMDLDDQGEFEKDMELRAIVEDIDSCSIDEIIEEKNEMHLSILEEMISKLGVEIDLNEFGKTPTEILANIEQIKAAIFAKKSISEEDSLNRAEKKSNQTKKSKKQLEKELREKEINDAKSKNIGSIYKQLAKLLHPDLEQDPQKKAEKEELMKEVVIAYQNKDLHKLLQLELKWIQKENDNLENLSDEKLKIYNEILIEQINELNEQFYLIRSNPRYLPIQNYFDRNFKNSSRIVSNEAHHTNFYKEGLCDHREILKIDSLKHLQIIAKMQKKGTY